MNFGRPRTLRRSVMRRVDQRLLLLMFFIATAALAGAQSDYRVVAVTNGGAIFRRGKRSGSKPRSPAFPVTQDPQNCDPDFQKTVDLDRLIVGPPSRSAATS